MEKLMKYQLGNHKSFILKQSNIQSYNLKFIMKELLLFLLAQQAHLNLVLREVRVDAYKY